MHSHWPHTTDSRTSCAEAATAANRQTESAKPTHTKNQQITTLQNVRWQNYVEKGDAYTCKTQAETKLKCACDFALCRCRHRQNCPKLLPAKSHASFSLVLVLHVGTPTLFRGIKRLMMYVLYRPCRLFSVAASSRGVNPIWQRIAASRRHEAIESLISQQALFAGGSKHFCVAYWLKLSVTQGRCYLPRVRDDARKESSFEL